MDKISKQLPVDCAGCNRFIDEDKIRLRRIVTSDTGRFDKYCSDCVKGITGVKDVWYGYGSGTHIEENICDPATGNPIPFSSKSEKYAAMQKAGVVEAGDRIHGSRSNFTNKK